MMRETCGEPVHNRRLIRASGVIDAAGVSAAPAVLLIEDGRLCAVGTPSEIGEVPDAFVEDHRESLIMPGLVNVHAHLDLSGQGLWPPAGDDFRGWVGQVRQLRAESTPEGIKKAVCRGIQLSLAGGTTCIGDVAGHPPAVSIEALRASPLRGISFIECFGLGSGQPAAIDRMHQLLAGCAAESDGIQVGVSPHAPYSCGSDLFTAAAATGRPLMTHLAETPGEVELLQHGTGPLRSMLEHDIGVWDASTPIAGMHPVEYAIGPLAQCRGVATHLNWIEPRHIDMLANTTIQVAYCPRASTAFGHGPPTLALHPWQALRAAGVPIGLGTDSLLCLDTPDRISVLDEMRLLAMRDTIDPMTLLEMATIDGARVLDLDPSLTRVGPSAAGLIACPALAGDPIAMLRDVLGRTEPPSWILHPADRIGLRTVPNTRSCHDGQP